MYFNDIDSVKLTASYRAHYLVGFGSCKNLTISTDKCGYQLETIIQIEELSLQSEITDAGQIRKLRKAATTIQL